VRKLFLIVALLASVGCERANDMTGGSPKRAPQKIMMQIICCAPGYIKPTDAGTCTTLSAFPENISIINGVQVWGTKNAAACTNLDETPYWGEQ